MEHELDGAADMTAVQPVAVEPARNSVVETKVAAQSATGITIGLLTWALTYSRRSPARPRTASRTS